VIATQSDVQMRAFGRTRDGRVVTCFTVSGGGASVEVLDYGAVVRALAVPNRAGEMGDVVLGYDDLASYERDRFYLGAVIGRHAGRIGRAAFAIDGERHRLTANDGANHLHGGARGWDRAVWRAQPFEDGDTAGVVLRHSSPDGDEGYPGNVDISITYALSSDRVFSVEYRAAADRATPLNSTQHAYFNLAGEGAGDVLGHELALRAAWFTPLADGLLPTGQITPVEGTPLDFRRARAIGARIGEDHGQLRIGGGYDHFFVVDGEPGTLRPAARVEEPRSGRVMEAWTTAPGMQLYTGNFLDGSVPGKHGHRYRRHAGLCLETGSFPDSPNQPGFPPAILRPGEEFRSRTEFRFSTRPS
jgi:aldose 1-epimerase